MMKKLELIGYLAKSSFNKKDFFENDPDNPRAWLFKTIGNPEEYAANEWPPYKVKVTIEIVDENNT